MKLLGKHFSENWLDTVSEKRKGKNILRVNKCI